MDKLLLMNKSTFCYMQKFVPRSTQINFSAAICKLQHSAQDIVAENNNLTDQQESKTEFEM